MVLAVGSFGMGSEISVSLSMRLAMHSLVSEGDKRQKTSREHYSLPKDADEYESLSGRHLSKWTVDWVPLEGYLRGILQCPINEPVGDDANQEGFELCTS